MFLSKHLPGRKSYTRSKSLLWTDDKSFWVWIGQNDATFYNAMELESN